LGAFFYKIGRFFTKRLVTLERVKRRQRHSSNHEKNPDLNLQKKKLFFWCRLFISTRSCRREKKPTAKVIHSKLVEKTFLILFFAAPLFSAYGSADLFDWSKKFHHCQ
jgi:hypothetical protein